jgi:hypothetical protein
VLCDPQAIYIIVSIIPSVFSPISSKIDHILFTPAKKRMQIENDKKDG